MRDRGWRRAQRERKIAAVKEWLRYHNGYFFYKQSQDEQERQLDDWARRRHGARATCSGFCCGNPRRHFGEVTMAERRMHDDAEQEV